MRKGDVLIHYLTIELLKNGLVLIPKIPLNIETKKIHRLVCEYLYLFKDIKNLYFWISA